MLNSEFEKGKENPADALLLVPLGNATGATCNAYTARIFGKKVFIKEIRPEFADDARMLSAFRKEAELGFRLDHPNLPQYIYAEGVLPSERYIVQEFIDGQTLPDFISQNPVYFQNKKNVRRFIRELADVIDYLHRNGIIYLDLKPENIIISRVGTSLKLVDLGFCASDFYDDTRGFTRSELSPEGEKSPSERGIESDYYGIGKILTFIRINTPAFPKNSFRKLEKGLLLEDPSRRLASKEDIEKSLSGSLDGWRLWLVVFSALLVLAFGIFLIVFPLTDKDSQEKEAIENPESVEVKDQATNAAETESVIEKENTPTEESTSVQVKNQEIAPGQEIRETKEKMALQTQSEASASNEFSYESYEKLKKEITENINKNFAGFQNMLSTYLHEEKFSEKDRELVLKSYNEALNRAMATASYKVKYKNLSSSVIDDTMGEIMQDVEKRNWLPDLKKYLKKTEEYQKR